MKRKNLKKICVAGLTALIVTLSSSHVIAGAWTETSCTHSWTVDEIVTEIVDDYHTVIEKDTETTKTCHYSGTQKFRLVRCRSCGLIMDKLFESEDVYHSVNHW